MRSSITILQCTLLPTIVTADGHAQSPTSSPVKVATPPPTEAVVVQPTQFPITASPVVPPAGTVGTDYPTLFPTAQQLPTLYPTGAVNPGITILTAAPLTPLTSAVVPSAPASVTEAATARCLATQGLISGALHSELDELGLLTTAPQVTDTAGGGQTVVMVFAGDLVSITSATQTVMQSTISRLIGGCAGGDSSRVTTTLAAGSIISRSIIAPGAGLPVALPVVSGATGAPTSTAGEDMEEEEEDDHLQDWEIALIVVGIVLFALLVAVFLYMFCCKKDKKDKDPPPPVAYPPRGDPTYETSYDYSDAATEGHFEPGQIVQALYLDGEWYDATVRMADGVDANTGLPTYQMEWYDGSISDNVPAPQIRPTDAGSAQRIRYAGA